MDGWMDGWIVTLLQSYQDDGWVIMKGCVQWNPVHNWKALHLRLGSNPGPLDQLANP